MASTLWLRLPTTCDSLWSLVHRTDLPLLVYQPTGGQRTIPAYWVQTLQHGKSPQTRTLHEPDTLKSKPLSSRIVVIRHTHHTLYVYMYICIYVYMYICIYVYMYICIYVYMYICIYVYMYICIYVYMHICIYVYMYIIYIYNMYIMIVYLYIPMVQNFYWPIP